MTRSSGGSAFGFVTAVRSEDVGFVGGLLVVNHLGRPLEFHATTPIRPSRAHEILYGPTLVPFLMGERIAASLVDHAKAKLSVILTDSAEVLAGMPNTKLGPICVSYAGSGPTDTRIGQLRIGQWIFTSAQREPLDHLQPVLETMQIDDWHEPFERIREALEEAQRSARSAPARRVGDAA